MFKEVESHFANLPSAEIRRSKFRRPHTVKTTANFGYLFPFYTDEILPGDTFKISYSMLVRLSNASQNLPKEYDLEHRKNKRPNKRYP